MGFRLTALEVAAGGSLVAVATYVTRLCFDYRDTWWKRTQWALDKALSRESTAQEIGLATATEQANRLFIGRRDRELLADALVELSLRADRDLEAADAIGTHVVGSGDAVDAAACGEHDDGQDDEPGRPV